MVEIIAIVLSPVLALVVGQLITDRKEKTRRRHQVFQSLWLTRCDLGSMGRLSAEHVRALNTIEIEFSKTTMDEFYGRDEHCAAVIQAWRKYRAALHAQIFEDPSTPEAAVFFTERDALLVHVLFEMSAMLGYSFTHEEIQNSSYAPIAYLNIEGEAGMLRRMMLELVDGKRALHVTAEPPKPL